jgi:hypothetical protein
MNISSSLSQPGDGTACIIKIAASSEVRFFVLQRKSNSSVEYKVGIISI